jgi:hypothetical protein
MASSTGKNALSLGWMAAGTLFSLALGGVSFAVAASQGGEDIARLERARANLFQELAAARRETESARSETARLDRVRAGQFGELVALRRELASARAGFETAAAARTAAQSAEIARLDRVRQTLFEELVGTRRALMSARVELHAAAQARSEADASRTGQTGLPMKEAYANVSAAAGDAPIHADPTAAVPADRTLRPPSRPASPSAGPVRVPSATSSIPKASPRNPPKPARPKPPPVRAETRTLLPASSSSAAAPILHGREN